MPRWFKYQDKSSVFNSKSLSENDEGITRQLRKTCIPLNFIQIGYEM